MKGKVQPQSGRQPKATAFLVSKSIVNAHYHRHCHIIWFEVRYIICRCEDLSPLVISVPQIVIVPIHQDINSTVKTKMLTHRDSVLVAKSKAKCITVYDRVVRRMYMKICSGIYTSLVLGKNTC